MRLFLFAHFYDIKDEATSDQFAIVQVKQTAF